MHMSIKYKVPVKVLAILPVFPIVSYYKENGFSLNLREELFCHKKNTQEFPHSEDIRGKK